MTPAKNTTLALAVAAALTIAAAATPAANVVDRPPTAPPEQTRQTELTKADVLPGLSLTPDEQSRREIRMDYRLSIPKSMDFVLDPFEKTGRGQVFSEPIRITNNGQKPLKVTISGLCAANGPKPQRAQIAKPAPQPPTIGQSTTHPGTYTIGQSQDQPVIGQSQDEPVIGQSPTIGESNPPLPATPLQPATPIIGQSENTKTYKGTSQEVVFVGSPIDPLTSSKAKEIQLLFHRVGSIDPPIVITRTQAEPIEFILMENEEAVFEITGTITPNPEQPWLVGDIHLNSQCSVEIVTDEEAGLLQN